MTDIVKTNHKNQPIFLIISIVLALVGMAMVILLVVNYGPRRPQTTVPEDTLGHFQPTATSTPTPTSTHQPEPTETTVILMEQHTPTATPTSSPSPTPTPEWMVYDGIDMRDQEIEVLINMACEDDQVYMSPFKVLPYAPELVETGLFYSSLDFSIAWEHLGYYGIFIHSGRSQVLGDLPAYPFQIYIENDARGYRRYPEDLFNHLQTCLIGAEMRLRQGDRLSINEVVAAVRIPPSEVDEVSRQPMNMVPYLAENYPESGFDQMEAPGLLFYFCGRQLSGEPFNIDFDYWTQSRIIIGFMPVSSN